MKYSTKLALLDNYLDCLPARVFERWVESVVLVLAKPFFTKIKACRDQFYSSFLQHVVNHLFTRLT